MSEEETETKKLRGQRALLDWLARIRVAGVEASAYGLGVSPRQVHKLAAALAKEKLVDRPRAQDGGGAVMVVTPKGTREALVELRSNSVPRSEVALAHGRGLSWIAAHSEQRSRRWYGPLELRAEGLTVDRAEKLPGGERRQHIPDLVVLRGEDRWAIEFERVPKAPERLRKILEAYRSALLAGRLDGVLYVCGSTSIESLVNRTREGLDMAVGVQTLDSMVAEVRESST